MYSIFQKFLPASNLLRYADGVEYHEPKVPTDEEVVDMFDNFLEKLKARK